VTLSADHLLRIFVTAVTFPIMTMTFDIPADVQAGVADIPGLDTRVAMYLRHEAQLEAVRRQRHSAEARGIVQRALQKADADRAAGFEWDASFAELQKLHQDITSKL
jgi:hypothetical protein